jgi:hypothetical protein
MKRSSAFAAWLGGLAAILAFMTLAMGQLAPRFLLQSYLWGAAAVAATPHSKGARVLFVALCIQGGVSLSMAWFGALTLGPGSLGQSSRDSVMDRAALGASEARWMDRVLPADAVALTSAHSLALLPRAFLLDDEDSPYGLAEGSTVRAEQRRRKLVAFLKANHANTVVSEPDSIVEDLLRDCLAPIAGPEVFPVATRNPANRGATHKLEASRIAWERPGCALH